jgi:taurine transport system substrate-binding protein
MVAFVKAMDKADAEYNSNPTAWTPDSDVVKTLAQMTGAAPADIPAIAKGYSFPSVADQLSDKWFGGAVQQGLPSIAKFLVEQKRIPKALDDYSPFVNTEFLKKAAQ